MKYHPDVVPVCLRDVDLEPIHLEKSLPKTLPEEVVLDVLAAPNSATLDGMRDIAFMEPLRATGMRVVEAQALNVEDLAGRWLSLAKVASSVGYFSMSRRTQPCDSTLRGEVIQSESHCSPTGAVSECRYAGCRTGWRRTGDRLTHR